MNLTISDEFRNNFSLFTESSIKSRNNKKNITYVEKVGTVVEEIENNIQRKVYRIFGSVSANNYIQVSLFVIVINQLLLIKSIIYISSIII